jgi:hypothetical protein
MRKEKENSEIRNKKPSQHRLRAGFHFREQSPKKHTVGREIEKKSKLKGRKNFQRIAGTEKKGDNVLTLRWPL